MNAVKPYNRESLDKQKLLLQKLNEKGYTRYYEILVDGKRVVYKTGALEEFDSYQQWVDEDTQSLRLMIYNTQNSHRAQVIEYRTDKYLDGESNLLYHTRSRKLSETEIEKRAEALFKEKQRERDFLELEKKNTELLKRLEDAEQYIYKLEAELKAQKEEKESSLVKTIETLAEMYFGKNNTNKAPGENADSLNGTDTSNQEKPMTCIIKKKTTGESSENIALNDTEKKELETLRFAKQALGKENYVKTCEVFDFLVNNPICINTVHESVMGLGR